MLFSRPLSLFVSSPSRGDERSPRGEITALAPLTGAVPRFGGSPLRAEPAPCPLRGPLASATGTEAAPPLPAAASRSPAAPLTKAPVPTGTSFGAHGPFLAPFSPYSKRMRESSPHWKGHHSLNRFLGVVTWVPPEVRHLMFWQKPLPVRAAILGVVTLESRPDPPSCVLAAAGPERFRHLRPGPPSWALPTLICGQFRPLGSGVCRCPSHTRRQSRITAPQTSTEPRPAQPRPARCPQSEISHEFLANVIQKQPPINTMVVVRLFSAYKSFISPKHHQGLQSL